MSDVTGVVVVVPGAVPATSIAPPPWGTTCFDPAGNVTVTGASPGLTTAHPFANSRS